jgi:Flp pilus assembly protein TadD
MDDGIAENKRAQELEPLSLINSSLLGLAFHYGRQYDRAIGELRKSLELDTNFAQTHLFLGWAYEQPARYEDAIAEFQKGLTLSGRESEMFAALGHAYGVSGKRAEAEKVLATLKEQSTRHYVAPLDIPRLRRPRRQESHIRVARQGLRGSFDLADVDQSGSAL